jgi:peptidyl-prolyl cis-trans isomerase SurA
VNDQIIDNSDYQRAAQQLAQEAQQTGQSPADLAQAQKDLLRDLIDQQLLLSRGKELEINADAEVIRRLDEIRKEHNFDSMEDLQKAVRESGVSFEDFQATIKNQVITQEVVRDEVSRNLRMTAAMEKTYYEQHKQDFAQPEQVHLGEILIPTPDDPTDAQVAQAQAKADQVVEKLKTGAKFEDLAKQYSGGPNPDTGGDLGAFKRGALGSKALEDPVFALQAGQWTAPIRTRQGFVVLRVTEHTQAGIPPMSAVDEQVQEAMFRDQMQPALRAYLTGLREKAYIEVQNGFVDTGASANEVKPLAVGATPLPVSKKKKAAQKARLDSGRATPGASKTTATVVKPATATTGGTAMNSGAANSGAAGATSAKTVKVSTGKKPKKIRREKIRYGQSPRQSLPPGPEETATTGADQGPGATASGPRRGPRSRRWVSRPR